jgi:hypothetical protein
MRASIAWKTHEIRSVLGSAWDTIMAFSAAKGGPENGYRQIYASH